MRNTNRFSLLIQTIIAIALVVICVQNQRLISNQQSKTTQPIAFPAAQKVTNQPPIQYMVVPTNPDGSINVTIKSMDEIDVNLDEIGGWSISGSLPIKIKK